MSGWRACILMTGWLALLASCDRLVEGVPAGDAMDVDAARPTIGPVQTAVPYTGSEPAVIEAQATLTTGIDLHTQVLFRTCGPNAGVCHHAAEYPSLHTPANFLATIGAPCNVQSGTPEAVYDRCERPGDRLKLGDAREVEIGYVRYVAGAYDRSTDGEPDAETPGLHIHLADPLRVETRGRQRASFIRSFVREGRVEDLAYFAYETQWTLLDDRHVFGSVSERQATQVQELLAVGVIEGDANRNGVFGARMGKPLSLIEPGSPETSYLIARLRGVMQDEPIPGSRMPLANQPLSVPEMLALFCFVEGLEPNGLLNLESSIDYAGCSYAADPGSLNLLGSGVTWAGRVQPILEYNCGGCHSGEAAQGGLNLLEGNVYERLLAPSQQVPSLVLLEPGEPEQSYLWLKLVGGETIVGSRMPFNPATGEGALQAAELDDIRVWIEAGALEQD